MTPRHVFRAVSLVVALFGVALLMETGRLALALGAVAGTDTFVASTSAVGFWYQLSFMRLFGVALIRLAILSLWGASQLIAAQQRSLAQTLGGLFAALLRQWLLPSKWPSGERQPAGGSLPCLVPVAAM